MSDTQPERPSAGRRHLTLIFRIVGLLLLAFVVSKVEFRDSVLLANGERIAGEITGKPPSHWDDATRIEFTDTDGARHTYAAADLHTDEKTKLPDVNIGLFHIVRESEPLPLALGFLLYGCITQFGVLRWWLLLRAQGIRIGYGLANRLTFVGFFFNNVVPGPTGGDVVKAVYASRHTANRAQAIVTVVIDRVVGLLSLALIAGAVLVFQLDNPDYAKLAAFIGLVLGGFVVASVVFFSRRIRGLLRVEKWSAKLPGGGLLRKADEAVFLWRNHKKDIVVALLLSFGNQLSIQGIMILFGSALHVTTDGGAGLSWTTYMAVLPVALIASAVPMLPGGWGFREAAFVVCFGFVHVERTPAIALSVLNGMLGLVWSLVGGVLFLLDRSIAAPQTAAPPPNPSSESARPAG